MFPNVRGPLKAAPDHTVKRLPQPEARAEPSIAPQCVCVRARGRRLDGLAGARTDQSELFAVSSSATLHQDVVRVSQKENTM